jgi:hypothetical protein
MWTRSGGRRWGWDCLDGGVEVGVEDGARVRVRKY